MEGASKKESVTGPEFAEITKVQVWEELRARGLEAPGNRGLVEKWTIQQEEKVVRGTSRDAIILNVNRGDLYVAAGDRPGALGCLEDARRQDFQENDDDLGEIIEDKMDGIEM